MTKEHHVDRRRRPAKQKKNVINRRALWKLADVALLAFGLQPHGEARAASFITFDVPGSVCLPSFPNCTTPTAINPEGTITGYYADATGALHGFLRASDGTFTKFDVPGATCQGIFSICTLPSGIIPAGIITGASGGHGFLRAPNGTFTIFDPPGGFSTDPKAINPAGAVAGGYFTFIDGNFAAPGFVRAPNGTITTFGPDPVSTST